MSTTKLAFNPVSGAFDLVTATIDLANDVTGILPIINGGTNSSVGNLFDNALRFVNAADNTKKLFMDLSSNTTGVTATLTPLLTSNAVLNIQPLVDTAANFVMQNATSGQVFIGANATIGGSNSGIQYSNSSTANRGQIKLGSYFNGTSIAGVSTLTSRSGIIGTNTALVAGQDYSKWTAQAAATTPGSAPIGGTFAFKVNTVNSLTVTSDYHIALTNLAGTLGDRLYLGSEGALQLPKYTAGIAHFDASGNITSSPVSLTADVSGTLPEVSGGTNQSTYTTGDTLYASAANTLSKLSIGTAGQVLTVTAGVPTWQATSLGSAITSLTGDVTATGPGAAVATIANAAVTDVKIANATIDLTTKVTGALPIANGGTGQTTKAPAFDALSPMTTSGDIIYGGAAGTGTRLPVGTAGQVLTVAAGIPSWAASASGSSNYALYKFNTSAGYGSTNNHSYYFTNTDISTDTSSLLSIPNNSTLGTPITCNRPCRITICATDNFALAREFGITKNANLSTDVSVLATSLVLSITRTSGVDQESSLTITTRGATNDVFNFQNNKNTAGATTSQVQLYVYAEEF